MLHVPKARKACAPLCDVADADTIAHVVAWDPVHDDGFLQSCGRASGPCYILISRCGAKVSPRTDVAQKCNPNLRHGIRNRLLLVLLVVAKNHSVT